MKIIRTCAAMLLATVLLALPGCRPERSETTWRLATPEEESAGIDGYVGDIPYSIKPETYKTMGRLSEMIAVKMIYYTKTKTGITIEVEE